MNELCDPSLLGELVLGFGAFYFVACSFQSTKIGQWRNAVGRVAIDELAVGGEIEAESSHTAKVIDPFELVKG